MNKAIYRKHYSSLNPHGHRVLNHPPKYGKYEKTDIPIGIITEIDKKCGDIKENTFGWRFRFYGTRLECVSCDRECKQYNAPFLMRIVCPISPEFKTEQERLNAG